MDVSPSEKCSVSLQANQKTALEIQLGMAKKTPPKKKRGKWFDSRMKKRKMQKKKTVAQTMSSGCLRRNSGAELFIKKKILHIGS